jgi:class 3 adenylate cyclase
MYLLLTMQDNCTVLFADIAGFTKYSGSVEPQQVVGMLRELFEEFDKSCLVVPNPCLSPAQRLQNVHDR